MSRPLRLPAATQQQYPDPTCRHDLLDPPWGCGTPESECALRLSQCTLPFRSLYPLQVCPCDCQLSSYTNTPTPPVGVTF